MIPAETFMDKYRAGRARAEDIGRHLAEWAALPTMAGPPPHRYLGMTWQQYREWTRTGTLPERGELM